MFLFNSTMKTAQTGAMKDNFQIAECCFSSFAKLVKI